MTMRDEDTLDVMKALMRWFESQDIKPRDAVAIMSLLTADITDVADIAVRWQEVRDE
jgi:hypothetical protein